MAKGKYLAGKEGGQERVLGMSLIKIYFICKQMIHKSALLHMCLQFCQK